MRPRSGLGALGLRARIVGAVLIIAVVTLGVAAAVLLGPLESSLRNAAQNTFESELRHATVDFRRLDLTSLLISDRAPAARAALFNAQQQLGGRIGATAAVLGYPDPRGNGQLLLSPGREGAAIEASGFNDVARAFRRGKPVYSFESIGGTEYARAALPFENGRQSWVLAVRRPVDEIPRAVSAVGTAFLAAALVALAMTAVLIIPLSGRLVRRLRRLRQAALRLANEGPGVEVPVDVARDEIGDLTRSFALMQSKLRLQEEARRAFVATASHELRTPLTSLEGMLELLREDLQSEAPDLEDAQALLDRARAQSRRLSRLAADLLDLSRLDAQVELRSEPVELAELSRAVMAEFELGTAERGVDTVLDDHEGAVWAMGDPGSVARILRILLDNAVRVSPRESVIKVELRNGDQACLTVSDHGPGVPAEERQLIFKRFMRGRETGGAAGFGLGLAIGHELAERMGGELMLEHHSGPGARFTLRLPVAAAQDEEPVALV
ncbi:MAG TPA: HAMP domain-containing sensor histidine kinase [Solirubrobacteraceae bacterium]|nr:HAMP domain-containing sensor histidine kinase [Solirubrobacteraceae bacterium]